jgi:mono/diheme cytochrome c family protein
MCVSGVCAFYSLEEGINFARMIGVIMLKLLVVLPSALFFALMPQSPATPDKPMPADAATLVNPVKSTPESQAHAKMVYGMDCAMCHGTKGDGKGDLVADMHLTMKDLTDPATLKDMSDGQIFYIIKNGKGQMPVEGDRAKDEGIWNLVLYVRSLEKK